MDKCAYNIPIPSLSSIEEQFMLLVLEIKETYGIIRSQKSQCSDRGYRQLPPIRDYTLNVAKQNQEQATIVTKLLPNYIKFIISMSICKQIS